MIDYNKFKINDLVKYDDGKIQVIGIIKYVFMPDEFNKLEKND